MYLHSGGLITEPSAPLPPGRTVVRSRWGGGGTGGGRGGGASRGGAGADRAEPSRGRLCLCVCVCEAGDAPRSDPSALDYSTTLTSTHEISLRADSSRFPPLSPREEEEKKKTKKKKGSSSNSSSAWDCGFKLLIGLFCACPSR